MGVNSIDDLTKTKASFTFKTANITGGGPLYDGDIGLGGGSCWGKHDPQPPYYYYVASCTLNGYNVTSTTYMYSEIEGEYIHTLVGPFGHSVISEAVAHGYQNMPQAMDGDYSGGQPAGGGQRSRVRPVRGVSGVPIGDAGQQVRK